MTELISRKAALDACQAVADEAKRYGIPQMTLGAHTCRDAILSLPTMTDAPEKIWATPDSEDGWRWPVASKFPMQGYSPDAQVSYTRSDMIDAADRIRELEAKLAQATDEALERAANVADDHTPEKHTGATLAAHVTGRSIAAAIRAMKGTTK